MPLPNERDIRQSDLCVFRGGFGRLAMLVEYEVAVPVLEKAVFRAGGREPACR
jgi:hypothetical protein